MNPLPSPITEAAGLLDSGVMYPRRVGLRAAGDPAAPADILVGFKRGGFSLYCGDAPIVHFDLEGRWQRAFVAGMHYLKGLDAQVRAVDRVREKDAMVLRRRTLTADETTALDTLIADQARTLRDQTQAGLFTLISPPAPSQSIELGDLNAILGKIAGWDARLWSGHQAAYRRAYGLGSPPFVPPDCPNPVILQPTPAMTTAKVRDHAREVAALHGGRLSQCRDVFLAGSGWINRPADEVVAVLAAIAEVFPIQGGQARPRAADVPLDASRLETIHGWLEAIPTDPPSAADWTRYRAASLVRVTVRLDSRSLDRGDAVRTTVAALKAAEIKVGVALFLDDQPRDDLVDLIGSLLLGSGDLITLLAAEGLSRSVDLNAWKARIAAAFPATASQPRVVIYNPDKQWI